jgi:hypothetical protein
MLNIHCQPRENPYGFFCWEAENSCIPTDWRAAVIQQHQAKLGRRRTYLSLSDAIAYDDGFRAFPEPLQNAQHTPYRDGWLDAQDDLLDQISNREAA